MSKDFNAYKSIGEVSKILSLESKEGKSIPKSEGMNSNSPNRVIWLADFSNCAFISFSNVTPWNSSEPIKETLSDWYLNCSA